MARDSAQLYGLGHGNAGPNATPTMVGLCAMPSCLGTWTLRVRMDMTFYMVVIP